jgi:signal peptidase II
MSRVKEKPVPTSDRSGISALRWLILSVIVIALDQWTKAIATASMQLRETIEVLPGLQWTLAHNPGVAFSMLSDGESWQRYGLSAFALIVSAAFIWTLTRLPRADHATKLAFSLVIGGALGNVIDRIRFGYVVDFIDVYWKDSHWPAFNIADSSIFVGAVVLLIWGWKHERHAETAAARKQA